ncbi:MAG: cob(I)yrinic acid a,c-diamide adenosyltransferase [Gemmataceae bacterium]|jgi:cob(I)alamin adenosyltransferase
MVYLSKIYTKVGDAGETSLGTGDMVSKDHPRIEAYGTVDELNSNLGIIVRLIPDDYGKELILLIQNDLFDLGADLCVPISESEGVRLRMQSAQWERLEREIDRYNESLAPLNSFVLPGGSELSCWLHIARTVCRRSERYVVHLGRMEKINQDAIIYLNRLSDLLFVMSRIYNNNGKSDILWTPGKNRVAKS